MVRLGSGGGDMKQLSPEAIDRGVAALRRINQIADSHGAPIRAVATSAVREAQNHDEFLAPRPREAGVEVEVISGVEEARLIHLGVLQALPVFDRRLLLCDIGGGSAPSCSLGRAGRGAGVAQLQARRGPAHRSVLPGERLHPAAVDVVPARTSARAVAVSTARCGARLRHRRRLVGHDRDGRRSWCTARRGRAAAAHAQRLRVHARRASRPSSNALVAARTVTERRQDPRPRRQAGRHHPGRRPRPRGRGRDASAIERA